MKDETAFSLEEYKLTKERIIKNEERRYQLLILNITAFGAVFGFSDKISDPFIPIVLLGILIVCSRAYSFQTRLQRFNIAYIIERFESKIDSLNLETGYAIWSARRFRKREPLIPRSITFLLQPNVILLFVSLIGGAIMCSDWLSKLWTNNGKIWVVLYSIGIIVGHIPSLTSIMTYRELDEKLFRDWWAKYLNKDF